ncbi:hypothetical protein [Bdellovibrio bacteriovorus]|uniref:hypothetical protein n=1 Tax=Bdellovibrio bacteriovorus TaxID=959 RepID=UPI0035A5B1A7
MKIFLPIILFSVFGNKTWGFQPSPPLAGLFCKAQLLLNGDVQIQKEGVTSDWKYNFAEKQWEINFTDTLPFPLSYTASFIESGEAQIMVISQRDYYYSSTGYLHSSLPKTRIIHEGKDTTVNQLTIHCRYR